jgi:hypothetical protein
MAKPALTERVLDKPFYSIKEVLLLLDIDFTTLRKTSLVFRPVFPGCRKLIISRNDLHEYYDRLPRFDPDFDPSL